MKILSDQGHTSDINSVKFHPSGDAIATGSDDATCRHVHQWLKTVLWSIPDYLHFLFLPDCLTSGRMPRWRVTKKKRYYSGLMLWTSVYLADYYLQVCIQYHKAITSHNQIHSLRPGYNDYTVNLWDTLKCERITVLYGHENRVSSLKVSPDGTAIGTASWDTTIRIWA